MEVQTFERTQEIMLAPTKDQLDQEFKKGEVTGLSTMMNYPGAMILGAEELLELVAKDTEMKAEAEAEAENTEESSNGDES